jgi:hypothetical protein
MPHRFEWDDVKAGANLLKHGVLFPVAIAVFADPQVKVIDTVREIDGEHRRKAVGLIQGRLFTIVFVMRGHICRMISARRANVGEERACGTRDA